MKKNFKYQIWKEKILSNWGRQIPIKAVDQAIPIYAIGCFKILDAWN